MENKEYMLIDGNPVEINGEKNLLEVIRKAGMSCPPSAITASFPYTAHAACAW